MLLLLIVIELLGRHHRLGLILRGHLVLLNDRRWHGRLAWVVLRLIARWRHLVQLGNSLDLHDLLVDRNAADRTVTLGLVRFVVGRVVSVAPLVEDVARVAGQLADLLILQEVQRTNRTEAKFVASLENLTCLSSNTHAQAVQNVGRGFGSVVFLHSFADSGDLPFELDVTLRVFAVVLLEGVVVLCAVAHVVEGNNRPV